MNDEEKISEGTDGPSGYNKNQEEALSSPTESTNN